MPTHHGGDDPADFEPIARPARPNWDDVEPDGERSTYQQSEHGPEPVPAWLITSGDATQHELGALKSGKEGDVFLVERRDGDRVNVLAAKRYRDLRDRVFRDDARYRQGRRTGDARFDKAVAAGTKRGMRFRAETWMRTEFETLGRLWSAGASVPYPVQLLGHELLMEYLGDDDGAAPRLVQARVDRAGAVDLYEQLVETLLVMARSNVVHGDLSPFNALVWEGRLYLIDFPQAVDPYLNGDGLSLLHHDVVTMCSWFTRHGVDCDAVSLYADLLTETLR